ncbi:HAD family hydrolase [Streptomyces lasiicapitis]|uniref:HAD family hydrolase n=1 Tax=Streptomyces lasiicapitis TaxID=1923961 RepID=UPI00364DAC5D
MRGAVLLDLDGVLLDSRDAHLSTLAGVATASLGRRITTADLPPHAATTPRVDVLAGLGVADPDEICELWWAPALATASAELFPGVMDGLQALKDADVVTGLVTLQSRSRLPWLLPPATLGLLDTWVCREDAQPKPAPDGIFLALTRLGVGPREAVFVGDTFTDRQAALEAGVAFAGAGWGYVGTEGLAAAGMSVLLSEPTQIGPGLLDLIRTGSNPRRVTTRNQ